MLALAVIALCGTSAGFAEESDQATPDKPAPTRVDVVGNATINWHLTQVQPSARTAALIERYRALTAAHLAGVEPPAAAEPEPPVARDGNLVHRLPAELIPTMFFHPEEGTYCSDGSVPSPYEKQLSEEEGN